MKKNSCIRFFIISVLLMAAGGLLHQSAVGAETLRYSSSAQVREAFGMEGLNAFMQESGVELEMFIGSSSTAVRRLMNGVADIASSAERLHHGHQEFGYVEIPFCKAPLIVISNVKTPVRNISSDQLRDIFNGTLTNWKEVGGNDARIILYGRQNNSGTYAYFREAVLGEHDYRLGTRDMHGSKDVVDLVEKTPCAVGYSGLAYATPEVKMVPVKALRSGSRRLTWKAASPFSS